MISQLLLKSFLNYNPDTGIFTWAVNKPPRAKIGNVAGYDNGHGYVKISIKGKQHYAHRLAFIWMGEALPKEIDHINQCRSDNRWCNLRAVTHNQNLFNVKGRSGIRQRYGNWYARAGKNHIGVFKTKEQAEKARLDDVLKVTSGINPNEKRDAFPTPTTRSKVNHYKFQGKSLSEWSRDTGIPQPTLYWRIFKSGMEPEKALGLSELD